MRHPAKLSNILDLSDKLKKQAKQLVEEGTLTEPESFMFEKKPAAADVYKYMTADGSLK